MAVDAEPRPLTDVELDSIPTLDRLEPHGLTETAKRVYRELRRFARGGTRAYPFLETLAGATGDAVDVVAAALEELVARQLIARTGELHGRAAVFELLDAAGLVVRQGEALRPLPLAHLVGAAASPSPAEAGSAAAKNGTSRRTGFRFKVTGPSGVYIRDLEGTDRPPAGYFDQPERFGAEQLEPVEDVELNNQLRDEYARLAAELVERLAGFSGRPRGIDAGAGLCDDCGEHAERRERIAAGSVCRVCACRRYAAAGRLAAGASSAVIPSELDWPMPPLAETDELIPVGLA